jgi:predicted signal transduction protein with EAL and GGDEF domain
MHGKVAIPVTASIGVASFEPGCPFKLSAHLMKAADLALYNCKHSGRNCVKVFSLKPAAPAGAQPGAQQPIAKPQAAAPKPAAA